MGTIAGMNNGRRFNDPGVWWEKDFNTFFPVFD